MHFFGNIFTADCVYTKILGKSGTTKTSNERFQIIKSYTRYFNNDNILPIEKNKLTNPPNSYLWKSITSLLIFL